MKSQKSYEGRRTKKELVMIEMLLKTFSQLPDMVKKRRDNLVDSRWTLLRNSWGEADPVEVI